MKNLEKLTTSPRAASNKKLEVIAAITIGALAIGCFLLQALSTGPTTTRTEMALFNTLQFLLTVGFTWFGSRAVTRTDFEQNLKKFALSAYRRVADIENIVLRLIGEIRRLGTTEGASSSSEMTLLESIANDGVQIVRSSISDWADVIGDELLAIQNLSRLRQKQSELDETKPQPSERTDHDRLRSELERQIDAIRRSLPAQLAIGETGSPPDDFNIVHSSTWLSDKHFHDGGLVFEVVSGGNYPHARDAKEISPEEPLLVYQNSEGAFNIIDCKGMEIGRLKNNTPLNYPSFAKSMEACYGDRPIPARFEGITNEETRKDEKWYWFQIRILAEPIISPDYCNNLRLLRSQIDMTKGKQH